MSLRTRTASLIVVALLGCADEVLGQNWLWDARLIGLGSVGGAGNITADLIDSRNNSIGVPLPFGLFQVLRDRAIYDPDSERFDPIRATEFAMNPVHFIVGRRAADSAGAFLAADVRSARLSRDLARYAGFVPLDGRLGDAVSAAIGRTVPLVRTAAGQMHGVFVGVGPYLALQADGVASPGFSTVFSNEYSAPNARLVLDNSIEAQAAVAIAVGYRVRIPWHSESATRSTRDGLYVGANYNYLRGLWYENDSLALRIDTDGAGRTLDSSNLVITHRDASEGTGFALDLGVTAVSQHWEIGFGANRLLNRIDWRDDNRTTYTLSSVTSGNQTFIANPSVGDRRATLPIDYRGTVQYTTGTRTFLTAAGHGMAGPIVQVGMEQRFGRVAARVGAHFKFDSWNPSGGIGIRLTPQLALDFASFGTTANLERSRHVGIATSIRFHREKTI